MSDNDLRERIINPRYCCLQDKTDLERRLIIILVGIGVVCTVLLGTVIGLGVKTRQSSSSDSQASESSSCENPKCLEHSLLLLDSIDTTIDPCEDFYLYACGNYITNNKLKESFKYSMIENRNEETQKIILDILKNTKKNIDSSSLGKAIKMYNVCTKEMLNKNESSIVNFLEEHGGWPALKEENNANLKWDDILRRMALTNSLEINNGIFGLEVLPNYVNNTEFLIAMAPFIKEQVFLFDNRKEDQATKAVKNILKRLQQQQLTEDFVEKVATGIINVAKFITKLQANYGVSQSSLTPMDYAERASEDLPLKTIDELVEITENKLNWKYYFETLLKETKTDIKVSSLPKLMIENINYFKGFCKDMTKDKSLTEDITKQQFMDYVTFVLVTKLMESSGLRNSFTSETLEILYPKKKKFQITLGHSQTLCEIKEIEQLCSKMVVDAFSYSIAKELAKITSAESNKKLAQNMTEEIIAAFKEHLQNIDWMDDPTKTEALDKINSMKKYYVYPDWVTNDLESFYEPLKITEDHFQNVVNCKSIKRYRKFGQLVKPTKYQLWDFPPSFTNAFYKPQENSINILLGILQPPIIDSKYLSAMNYASLGMILGHEITHGFDLQGQMFDAKGNVRNWWSKEISEIFNKKADCYVKQYNDFKLTTDYISGISSPLQVNGKLTVSENIADNGGLQQAYLAFKKKMESEGMEATPFNMKNFTIEQIFFLSFAQLWCSKYSPEAAKNAVLGTHSPNPFRILGPLQNFPEFAKAFNCQKGSKMNPSRPLCDLW